jgi:hypothetical protein
MRHSAVVSITTEDGTRHAVSEERHPARSYGKMFHTTFDEAAAQIAHQITKGVTLRVYLVLPNHLSYTQFKRLDQRKLGALLKTDDSSISRALAELRKLGVVEKRGSGAHIEWKLSSDYGWRGDVASYHADQRKKGAKAPGAVDRLSQKNDYGN